MIKRYLTTFIGLACCAFAMNAQQIDESNLETYFTVSSADEKCIDNSLYIDVNKALYGKIAGLNVYQGAGASPDNIAGLSFHGHAPLVLVDGFPRDLKHVTSTEIESIYLLKDAVAAALYGVKGANGVLLITTKKGNVSKLNINVDYNLGISTQFRAPSFADAYTYAGALNSALVNDGLEPKYSAEELDAFKTGIFPYNYPNVDWWKETMNDYGMAHHLKMSFDGGSDKFRYFTVIDYYRDASMLKKNDLDNRYDTNPTDTRLTLRSNLDLEITPTTFLKVGIMGKLFETNGSRFDRNGIFNQIYRIPSAAFPIQYEEGSWGGNSVYNANNPVAILKNYGHRRDMMSTLYANMTLRQDLSAVTEGLSASLTAVFDNVGAMTESSSKEYQYMYSNPSIVNGALITTPVYYGKDSEVLGHSQGFKSLYLNTDLKADLTYDRAFGKHKVYASANVDARRVVRNGRNKSFSNLSYIFNASYNYADRYILNAVVNHSGSSYLPTGNKFRTYPAVSATWIASNEEFLKGSAISNLALRASYGLSGWDGGLSHELWRQVFGNTHTGYNFGVNAKPVYGQGEGQLPVVGLNPEKSEKLTLGLDFGVLNDRLSFSVDAFHENRSEIMVPASNRISGIIGIGIGDLCQGINEYRGFDLSIGWKDKVGDFSYGINANASYLNTKVVENNESFEEFEYLYRKGDRVGQAYGLEAIGFFNSQMEINNSPVQTFSEVKPGDIKYKDQNGDNIIDANDVVKMFGSSVPRFYFGFSFDLGYEGFELIADFQGLTGKTINLLNSPLYKPLVDNGNISNTFLDNEVCWSPEHHSDATMPRLTTMNNLNNYRNSSLWYRDGSYLKLRNLQLSYTFSRKIAKIADIKLYVAGTNLFSLDNIKNLDPEMLQVGYPSVRTFWAGLKFNF